jgi:deoxyadenosine/deoxycytidine kinase
MSPLIISIEGNIGSGKTTLLSALKKYYKDNSNIIFLKEPVDDWETITDENGNTILQKFYADQERYSFAFQLMAYISRLAILKETIDKNPDAIIITERCLYTDKMVFAKMLYDTQKIELINYKIYLKWFDVFASQYPINKIIYINTPPEICLERIHKRCRLGENGIPLEYLTSCHEYHDKMMQELLKDNICNHYLYINGSNDIYSNKDILNNWIEMIDNYIKNE